MENKSKTLKKILELIESQEDNSYITIKCGDSKITLDVKESGLLYDVLLTAFMEAGGKLLFAAAEDPGYEWTDLVAGPCVTCGRKFRMSEVAMESLRDGDPESSDQEICEGVEYCLSCASGESVPAEYKIQGGR